MNVRRILRVVKKELIQITRDRRLMGMLFLLPVLQLFLFGYAVSTDINHIATAILDEDRTAESRRLIARLVASRRFDIVADLARPAEVDAALDQGYARMVLRIPRGFAEALSRNRTVEVQTILDATDSSTARIIFGYTTAVIQEYSMDVSARRIDRMRAMVGAMPRLDGRLRVWYNPELKSVRFMVPAILCQLLLIATMMLTALTIVKERELGTLEQLVVTPLTPTELMLGKTLPCLLIGMTEFTLVLLVATSWFRVHVAGSVPLLFLVAALFVMTSLGLGIFVSTVSTTQQEATLTTFFIIFPFIMLSGFIFPIENMPEVIRPLTYAIPLRYVLEAVRGIFLKGNGVAEIWPHLVILAGFGVASLALSAARFRKRLG